MANSCLAGLEVGGEMNLTSGIQVALLALKHHQNKKQHQRIIVFAGSPVKYDKKVLEAMGKKLKKNSVALDIVDFGEEHDGKPEKLEALFSAINNNDTSHIVHVPPSGNALSDVLLSTPIFTGDGEGESGYVAATAAAAAAAAGCSGFDFGVDPNLDPELALALHVSMEEERVRQEATAKRAAEDAARQEKEGSKLASSSQDATMTEPSNSAHGVDSKRTDLMDDDTALLEQALAMSMGDLKSSRSVDASGADFEMSEATPEDQELAFALRMSVQENVEDTSIQTDMNKVLGDQYFVSSILASLPGVDPNDPSVKDLFTSLKGQSKQKKDDKDPDDKDK